MVSFTSWKDRLACDIFVNGQEHQSTARVGRTIKLSGVLAGLVTNIFFLFYWKEMMIMYLPEGKVTVALCLLWQGFVQ